MTYTPESDIEAMAEAMVLDRDLPEGVFDYEGNDLWCIDFIALAKAALAASSVHAELARVNAECEKLRKAMSSAYDRSNFHDARDDLAIALQQKDGEDVAI